MENNDNDFNMASFDVTDFANNSTMNNKQAVFNDEMPCALIRDEREHEFICLEEDDNRTILAEGKAFNTMLSTATANSNFNYQVFVISFMGDTAASKSSLANQRAAKSFVLDGEDYQSPNGSKCNVSWIKFFS